jgi:hypothetical protein
MIQTITTNHSRAIPMTRGDRLMAEGLARMSKKNDEAQRAFKWDDHLVNEDNVIIAEVDSSKLPVECAPMVDPPIVAVPIKVIKKPAAKIEKVIKKPAKKVTKTPPKKTTVAKKVGGNSTWSWTDVID